MQIRQKRSLRNVSLKKKITIITLLVICLTSITSLTGYFLMLKETKKTIEQQASAFLTSVVSTSSTGLDTVRTLSGLILSDTSIQNTLALMQTQSDITNSMYQSVRNRLVQYQERYENTSVDAMGILADSMSIEITNGYSQNYSDNIGSSLRTIAQNAGGSCVWVTEYADTYGVFLVREIREISNLSLADLGTLVIHVDMDRLIQNANVPSWDSSVSVILSDNGTIIYSSDSLKQYDLSVVSDFPKTDYGIRKIGDARYFIVPATIPDAQWDAYSLLPYESIYEGINRASFLYMSLLVLNFLLCMFVSDKLMASFYQDLRSLMNKIRVFGGAKDLDASSNKASVPDVHAYDQQTDEIGQLHQQFDNMADRIQTLVKENYETKLLAKDSQLKALEMQINPHFLYNTLQSINWRAKLLGDEDISRMTEALGKLLRITLSNKNADSTLKQEIDLVNYYMTIQTIRYDGRLTCRMDMPQDLMDLYLPKFTIQPFIENAIRYSLDIDSDNCDICITAEKKDRDRVKLLISNTGSEFPDDLLEKLKNKTIQPHGFGIGILNVYRRLNITYGDQSTMKLWNEDDMALVEIEVPYIKAGASVKKQS